jgi:RNA cap guanine-N2 methyltransferase
MELWEIHKFGADTFGDPEHVCLYGMKPTEWYGRGVRLLARTTLEAVSDQLGDMIGRDVARVLAGAPAGLRFGVVDPFTGSCNGLYSILRHVKGTKGIGFEFERSVFDLTQKNIAALNADIEIYHGDFRKLLAAHRFSKDHGIVAFLAPPWGDALSSVHGLDLTKTKPPVSEIVDQFERVYAGQPMLYVTQVHERLVSESLAALKRNFDWSDLNLYNVNVAGSEHGILLGTRRWVPPIA